METVTLGPVPFSADEKRQCAALLQSLKNGLVGAATNQYRWHRAIAAVQLRLAEFEESLAHLELALPQRPKDFEHARILMLKAIALRELGRLSESRAAFDKAEALMRPSLLDDLSHREGFLNHDERSCLVLRREAAALLRPE